MEKIKIKQSIIQNFRKEKVFFLIILFLFILGGCGKNLDKEEIINNEKEIFKNQTIEKILDLNYFKNDQKSKIVDLGHNYTKVVTPKKKYIKGYKLKIYYIIRIFYFNDLMLGVHGISFRVFPNAYASDQNHAYWLGERIEDSDGESFKIFHEESKYASDQNHAYWLGEIIEDSHGESFEIFNPNFKYARDENYVYYLGKKIIGANPKYFSFFKDYSNIASDGAGRYFSEGEMIGFSTKTSEADPYSLRVIYDYRCDEKGILEKQCTVSYARDKDYVYHILKSVKVVEGADPETFEVNLNKGKFYSNYARDKDHAYWLGKKIEDSDGESFQLVDTYYDNPITDNVIGIEDYARDKNFIYYKGEIVDGKNKKLTYNEDPEIDEQYYRNKKIKEVRLDSFVLHAKLTSEVCDNKNGVFVIATDGDLETWLAKDEYKHASISKWDIEVYVNGERIIDTNKRRKFRRILQEYYEGGVARKRNCDD